jgi:hypothetical protein
MFYLQSAALKTSDHWKVQCAYTTVLFAVCSIEDVRPSESYSCGNSLGGTAKAFELAYSPHHHHWVLSTDT